MPLSKKFDLDEFEGDLDIFNEFDGIDFDVNFDFLNRSGLDEINEKSVSDIPENAELSLYWMGKQIGTVVYNQGNWDFSQNEGIMFALSESKVGLENTRIPFFVDSLMPESWIRPVNSESIVDFDPEFPDRYLSNIVIRPAVRTDPIIIDKLQKSLSELVDDRHEFVGSIDQCFIPTEMEQSCLELKQDQAFNRYAAMHMDVNTPRISGVQQKLPAFITQDGMLTSAIDNSFTHIIKYPDSRDDRRLSLGAVEWFCTLLAKKCGIDTEEFAITNMPGFGPVFIAERFDLRRHPEDNDAILAEDFCSALSLKKSAKYSADLQQVMSKLIQSSTDPDEDARKLLRIAVYSWLVENDDLHLKNLMLLKRSACDFSELKSVRLSPAYDILATSLYDPQPPAMLLYGSEQYNFALFKKLGASAGISDSETKEIIQDLIDNIRDNTDAILKDLPECILSHEKSIDHLQILRGKFRAEQSRIARMDAELSQYKTSPRPR